MISYRIAAHKTDKPKDESHAGRCLRSPDNTQGFLCSKIFGNNHIAAQRKASEERHKKADNRCEAAHSPHGLIAQIMSQYSHIGGIEELLQHIGQSQRHRKKHKLVPDGTGKHTHLILLVF